MHTQEQIKEAVKNISNYSDEQLIHEFKSISSKSLKKEKEIYKPLLMAIEKERKKRGTSVVSTKVDAVKEPKIEWEK